MIPYNFFNTHTFEQNLFLEQEGMDVEEKRNKRPHQEDDEPFLKKARYENENLPLLFDIEKASLSKKRTIDRDNEFSLKKIKLENPRALEEFFNDHPAFFHVDEEERNACINGELTNIQTDVLLWKYVYRLYALYTFTKVTEKYTELPDFIFLDKILKVSLSSQSKACDEAQKVIKQLESKNQLTCMFSLNFLKKNISVDEQLLLHVISDQYGKDSGYEGMDDLTAIEFAINCFKIPEITAFISEHSFEFEESKEKILSLLQDAKEFENLFNKLKNIHLSDENKTAIQIFETQRKNLPEFVQEFKQKLLDALERKKSTLIPGGWTGHVFGHSIYYKIEEQEDKRYTFTVFNRGEGFKRNGSVYESTSDGICQSPSSLTIKNIQKENLIDDLFIQSLIELKVFAEYPYKKTNMSSTSYDADDLYDGILPLLKGEVVKEGTLSSLDLMSSQVSGTCSWKSLAAFIRSELSFSDYRLWATFAMKTALLNYFDRCINDNIDRSFFEKNLESMWNTLKKMSPDIFSSEENQQLLMHVDFLNDSFELEKMESLRNEKSKRSRQFNTHIEPPPYKRSVSAFKNLSMAFSYAEINRWDKFFGFRQTQRGMDVQSTEEVYARGLFDKIRMKVWSPKTLNKDLKSWIQVLECFLIQVQAEPVFNAFVEIMLNLPHFNNDFWRSFDVESTTQLMINISKLQKLFYKSSDYYETKHLAKTFKPVVALYKALALQDLLIQGNTLELSMDGLDRPPDYRELESLLINSENPQMNFLEHSFQSASLTDPKASDELEYIYTHLVSRFEENEGKSMLFFRPESTNIEVDGHNDNEEHVYLNFSINYKKDSIQNDTLNPQLQYLIKTIKNLDEEQLDKIEALKESVFEKDSDNEDTIQGDQFREYDIELKVCLALTHDRIAKIILPPHVYAYQKQMERTWFWMHNIAELNDECKKTLKIEASHNDPSRFSYHLASTVTTCKKSLRGNGIAFYLQDESNGLDSVIDYIQEKFPEERGKLSFEECKELKYIFHTLNSQIVNIVSYFTNHPEKLDHDYYRVFLNLVLFERNFLVVELEKNSFFFDVINKFLSNAIERAKHLNDLSALSDFMVLKCKIYDYCRFSEPERNFEHEIRCCIHTLKDVFDKRSDDERTNAARALIVCMSFLPKLSASDVRNFLFYHQVSSATDVQVSGIDPLIFEEVPGALSKLFPQIDTHVSKEPDTFLNPLLEKEGFANTLWEVVGPLVYRSSDNQCYFNILKGIYSIKDKGTLTLPKRILANSDYKKIFSKPYSAELRIDENGTKIYSIQKKGQKYDLFFIGNDLKIQKEENGFLKTLFNIEYEKSKEKFPESFNFSDFIPFKIIDSWNVWAYKKGEFIYIFEITDENDHELFVSRGFHNPNKGFSIDVHKGDGDLKILDISVLNENYQPLSAFCNPDEIIVSGRKNIEFIEIPKHQLTFKANPLNFGKFESLEFQGFYLSSNQYIEPLAEFSFHAYVVLQNDMGFKKVIVNARVLLNDSLTVKINKHYIFDYNHQVGNNKRILKAPGRIEKLVLAAIAFSSRIQNGYLVTRQLLQKNYIEMEDVSKEELDILGFIGLLECKGDPKETALKLMAHHALVLAEQYPKNQKKCRKIKSRNNFNLKKLLADYVRTCRYIPGFTLSEEAFVRLYASLATTNTYFAPEAIALFKECLPKLKSKDLIQFATGLVSYNDNSETKSRDGLVTHIGQPYKINTEMELKTRANSDAFFWDSMNILENHKTDAKKLALLQKYLDLNHGKSNNVYSSKRYILRILNCFLSNISENEVQDFIAKCNASKDDIENSEFKSFHQLNWAASSIADRYPPKNPLKGLDIPKFHAIKSKAYPTLRPERLYPHATLMTTGRQSLQKKRLFRFNNLDMSTPPSSDDYFDKKGELISHVEMINNEKRAKTALKVLDLETVDLNPLTDKVLKELKSGIEESCHRIKPKDLFFDRNNLFALIEELKTYIEAKKKEVGTLELYLINFAKKQSLPLDLNKSGCHVHLGLLDLIFLYAKEDLSSLPGIEGSNGIKDKITEFLVQMTDIQKWTRCLEKAYQIKENLQEFQLLIGELASLFKADRVFDPEKNPAALVLEYAGNILIRDEQFKKFTNLKERSNCILQMIPGSGKTSVLVKLLALLNADGKKLSCMILPEELFQSMQNEIIDGGSLFFNQLILPFEVTREGCNNIKHLEKIRDELRFVIERKGAVITPPSSIHTFYLLFIEAICLNKTNHIPLLKEILNIFKNESRVLIDEIDIILDIRKFINFSFGETVGLNQEDRALIAFIYKIILESPEITETLKFKFYSKGSGKDAKLFTKELYKPFKALIAKKVLLHLVNEYEELKPASFEKIESFLLQEDLKRAKEGLFEIQTFKNQALKNSLGLAKEQINALLPSTLIFNCNEDYGFSKLSAVELVIPYEKGNPVEGSRFGHPHEAANYTLQTALFEGVSAKALGQTLNVIKEDIIKDILHGKHPEATMGYRRFKELWRGAEKINPLSISPQQFSAIQKGINESHDLALFFAKNYLLPSIECDTKRLSSPVGMLYFLFGEQIEGFSGTLGNSDTYPLGVKCHPEPLIDGKTISLLVEHFINGIKDPLIIPEETASAIITAIKNVDNKAALIDGGGYLNQESPESLAKVWQNKLSFPLLCHDLQGDLFLQTEKGKENPAITKIAPEERFTIYRQPYATGTDILQSKNAVGIVTLSRNVQLRDIIQNVRRMRGLDGNQRIRFMLTKDVLYLISTRLNIDPHKVNLIHILKFALINQIERLQEDSVKSSLQQIQTALQSEILNYLLSEPFEASASLKADIESIFAPKHSTNAWDLYGHVSQEKATALILKEESEKVMSLLANISLLLNRKAIEEKILKINTNTLLPNTTIVNSNTEMNQQVKVETKQQMQVKEAMKTVVSDENPVEWQVFDWQDHVFAHTTNELSFVPLDFRDPFSIPHKCSFSFYPFNQYTPHIFSEKLMISINLALPSNFKINQTTPFGANQKKIGHVMIIQHVRGVSIVLTDPYDVGIAKNLESFPINCCLYNLVLGPERVGQTFDLYTLLQNKEAHLILLQARLLAGFWQFNEEEKALLKEWIGTLNREVLSDYFKNTLFKHYLESDLLCARIADLFHD